MLPPRRQRFSPGARILSVNLHLTWPSGEPLFPHDYGFVFPAQKHPRLEQATRRLLGAIRPRPRDLWEFVRHSTTLSSYLRFQQHLPEWLKVFVSIVEGFGCIPEHRGPTDKRLIRALHLLETLPATTAHPRRKIAEAAGISPSQLDRLFITHFGLTPRAYIDRHKFATACSALESSQSSIKEIAYRLGFRQPAHFTNWFRQQQRESPSAYRAARAGSLA
jgi:AraC-like DNA-binding protein